MSRTLEEAILHAEEAASDYEGMIEDYWLDSEKLAKCANEQRQLKSYGARIAYTTIRHTLKITVCAMNTLKCRKKLLTY